jgi:biopolymer transport protein ExbB
MRMRLLVPLILVLLTALPVTAQEPPVVSPLAPTAPMPGAPEVAPQLPGGAVNMAPVDAQGVPALTGAAPAFAAAPLTTEASADLLSIVLAAHWVVKSVMAVLAGMAFLVLTVLLYKTVEIGRAQQRLGRSFRAIAADGAAARLPAPPEAGAAMLRLVQSELSALPQAIGTIEAEGLRDRCRIGLSRVEATALHSLRSGVGFLAQVAATAPFIGLFGTVFGIMNAFLAIAATKTTSLSVVAPGIAEALMATAVGLGAAIPAVLVYNLLTRRIAVFRHRLGDVAALAERHLSREIDRRRLAGAAEGRP